MSVPLDYYEILQLTRSAADADIKSAYRKLALQFHPKTSATNNFSNPATNSANNSHSSSGNLSNGHNLTSSAQQFRLISEAYDVLISPEYRAIYDQYGEKALKSGVKTASGGQTKPYHYNSNPEQQFQAFFGHSSPFSEYFSADSSLFPVKLPQEKKETSEKLEQNLYVSLEELFLGCTKKIKVIRERYTAANNAISLSEAYINVEIGRGWRENTKLTFNHEGNQGKNQDIGDLVLIVKEKPHPRFKRDGNNLIFSHELSLLEALTGCTVNIPTLEGRILPVAINEIASSGAEKVIEGEGMPLSKDSSKRGNLIIKFNVNFPAELSIEQKNALQKILAP
jgi:DnaJ family protein B protein 13